MNPLTCPVASHSRNCSQDRHSRARSWLTTIFHAFTCDQQACEMGVMCSSTRGMLLSMFGPPRESTTAPFRKLLCHYVDCKDSACPVCTPLLEGLGVRPPRDRHGNSCGHKAATHRTRRCPSSSYQKPYERIMQGHWCCRKPGFSTGDEDISLAVEVAGSPQVHAVHVPIATQNSEAAVMVSTGKLLLHSLMAKSSSTRRGCPSASSPSGGTTCGDWLCELWHHMLHDCDMQTCTQRHCRWARSILTHLLSCTSDRCEVCDAIRAAFKRAGDEGLDFCDLDGDLDAPVQDLEAALALLAL